MSIEQSYGCEYKGQAAHFKGILKREGWGAVENASEPPHKLYLCPICMVEKKRGPQ